jgi:hypothetical protein
MGGDELRELVREVALAPPPGSRAAAARIAAVRLLEQLDRPPDEGAQALARLFAEDRDEGARVEPSDWHPAPGDDGGWVELDLCQTVRQRRAWYGRLVEQEQRT